MFGSRASIFNFLNLGSNLSIRQSARLGSSLSIAGEFAFALATRVSVIDLCNMGSTVSLRSFARYSYNKRCVFVAFILPEPTECGTSYYYNAKRRVVIITVVFYLFETSCSWQASKSLFSGSLWIALLWTWSIWEALSVCGGLQELVVV